jgi:hypothetical protein
MELLFAATLFIVMIIRALQQNSLCQQEVRIADRSARKK